MRRAVSLMVAGLLSTAVLAGAEAAACSATSGLYDMWLAMENRAGPRTTPGQGLLASSIVGFPAPERRQAIGQGYQAFFKAVSDLAKQKDVAAMQSCCREAGTDRLASLVCQGALYLKSGRTDATEFLDAIPPGRKGAELVWDLATVDVTGRGHDPVPALFLPKGPAYKLIDELFLLVLDDWDKAAAKYFALEAYTSGDGERYMDEQIKVLFREAPSVVVKEWPVLRLYRPKLKSLAAQLTSSLPAPKLQQLRKELQGFCEKGNPDCEEIAKIFGAPK